MLSNAQIAKILYEIAAYLEMQDVVFKPRAYEKAAQAVEASEQSIAELYGEGGRKALENIPGVGASIAEKLEELIGTGRLRYYETLKKKVPVDLAGLMAIEGVGPKLIKTLWEKLHIKNAGDLERAARSGKIRSLPRFGERSERKILKGIEFLKQHAGRFSIFEALPIARSIAERLGAERSVSKISLAGSLRRWKETIGDIDILVVSADAPRVMEAFLGLPEVMHVTAKGETKSAVRLESGIDVDLRVVPPQSFGVALNYFTGSKSHNVALRQLAIEQGYKLNEYGLFKIASRARKAALGPPREIFVAGATEEELYAKLGLRYIPPELREGTDEIAAARADSLPTLIAHGQLQGDLQTQSDWTDGEHSIAAMAEAAKRYGLSYIAVTDHTKNLAMTGGADERKILKQIAAIGHLNRTLRGFRVLTGAEVDVLRDGTLDIADAVLAQLDVVGVSVHTHFNLPKSEQTKRIIRAMENRHADILFHPTGRVVGQREAYALDMDAIIRTARRTGTVLEINASPRLDLKDEYIRSAVKAGVKLAINSDAHSRAHFPWLEYGLAQARRGWAKKSDVINTMPLDRLLAFLRKEKVRRF